MKRLVILLVLAAVVFTLLVPPVYSVSWDPNKPRYVHRVDRLPSPVNDADPWDIEKSADPNGGQVILPYFVLEWGQRLVFWFVSDSVADEETNITGVTVEEDDVRTGNTTATSARGATAR